MQAQEDRSRDGQAVRRRRSITSRSERRTPAQWAELIAAQRASGLTIRQFAVKHGIGFSTLGNQRRKLERAAAKPLSAKPLSPKPMSPNAEAPAFIEIPLRAPATAPAAAFDATASAEVMIGDTVRIRLQGAALSNLLDALICRIEIAR
ncbi:hypothetical protein EPO05_07350 [Patescibacteria group bacterium]|nr:MAG: hypothetical protein EPO05_07350 [Patescibacteria group bacterium]